MSRHATILRWVTSVAPGVSGCLLLVLIAWLCLTVSSRETMEMLFRAEAYPSEALSSPVRAWSTNDYGVVLLVAFAGLANGALLLGLFVGPREFRTLRSWLGLCLLWGGWLAVLLGWKDIYWLGQSWRAATDVTAAHELAESLMQAWPETDGGYPGLGFLLGYPKGRPTTWMLAGEPVAVGRLRIAAIEKSQDGQRLRFQLASPNADIWFVYSLGGLDDEFVDGMGTRYVARRSRRLAADWYLVLYDSA